MREPLYPRLNEAEFLAWELRQERKFELHHGFVVAFAGGTADHDLISFNVRKALDELFPRPCVTFGADLKLRIPDVGFFYCDAGVRCSALAADATVLDEPLLVAEVLSPSTRAYDLVEKRAAYRRLTSLRFIVIVHSDTPRIEVDARDGAGQWTTAVFDDDAELGAALLRLEDVYADTAVRG